jgi:hypothetical protein
MYVQPSGMYESDVWRIGPESTFASTGGSPVSGISTNASVPGAGRLAADRREREHGEQRGESETDFHG